MKFLEIPQIVSTTDLEPYAINIDFFQPFYQSGRVHLELSEVVSIDSYNILSRYTAEALLSGLRFSRTIWGRHMRVDPDNQDNNSFSEGPVEIIDTRRAILPNGLTLRSSRTTRGYENDRTIPHFSSHTIVGSRGIEVPGLDDLMEFDGQLSDNSVPILVPVLVTTARIKDPSTPGYFVSVDRKYFQGNDEYYLYAHNLLARSATDVEQSALCYLIEGSAQGKFLGPIDLSLEQYIRTSNPNIQFNS